jgi:hypothetical protein
MNRKGMLITLTILLLTARLSFAEGPQCSTRSVAGDWGFTLTGTILLPTGAVPAAAVGRLTADIYGNVTGTEARNVGGGYGDETITGSWKVNRDCTGSAAADFYDESGNKVRTSVLTIVFDDNSRQVRMVQKSLTLPNGTELPVVITVEAGKQ